MYSCTRQASSCFVHTLEMGDLASKAITLNSTTVHRHRYMNQNRIQFLKYFFGIHLLNEK